MGRLRVTPKGKVSKKNVPVTRVGKKQYLKRRFAHVRATERAGHDNPTTVEYHRSNCTAEQNYTRLGLAIDPSAPAAEVARKKKRVRKDAKGQRLEEPVAISGAIGAPVSELEGTMLCNLMLKYGTQFKRMSLDYKLNPFQLTPGQLQHKVVNYLKWEREAFPEEYKQMEEAGLIEPNYADPALRRRQLVPAAAAVANQE
jgi:hypothetical protein